MPEFGMWKGSEYITVMQHSNIQKYGWKCLNRTWTSLNISEFSLKERVLNMSHIQCTLQGHSTSWWLLIERWVYSEICQRSKVEHFGKTIVPFDYFHKTLHLNLWQGPNMYWFLKCQGSEYSRIVNMPGFWISIITQGLPIVNDRFLNMH